MALQIHENEKVCHGVRNSAQMTWTQDVKMHIFFADLVTPESRAWEVSENYLSWKLLE